MLFTSTTVRVCAPAVLLLSLVGLSHGRDEVSQLACLATQLPRQNIELYSFPESLFTGTRIHDPVFGYLKKGVFIWKVDFNILRSYVAQFQADSWPASASESSAPDTSTWLCQ